MSILFESRSKGLAALLALAPLLVGCGSNLAIQRQPLTGPAVLAEADGTFRIHATVTNFDDKPSAAATLWVRKDHFIGESQPLCAPLLSGCSQAKCDVPPLEPNESKSFNFPLLKGLCDKEHCCKGGVTLKLTDQSDKQLSGKDTKLQVTFGGNGDLSDMTVSGPGEAGFDDLQDCGTSYTVCP